MLCSEIKRNIPLLSAIINANTEMDRGAIIRHLNDDGLDFVCKCIKKIVYMRKAHEELKEALSPHADKLKMLSKKSVSMRKKRKIMKTSDPIQFGGAISLILSALVPILVSAITGAVSKK